MKRRILFYINRAYYRAFSRGLSLGLTLPFRLLDQVRFPELHHKEIRVANIDEEIEKLRQNISNAEDLDLEPQYLKLNPLKSRKHKKLRIAMLVNSRENHLINDVFEELRRSAISVGHICEIFPNQQELIVNQESLEDSDLARFLPNLVIVEAHNNPNKLESYTFRALPHLKDKLGFKVFLISIDLWRKFDIEFIQAWKDIYDVLIHLDRQSVEEFNLSKDFWWPYFSHPNSSHPIIPSTRSRKSNDLIFSGNLRFADRRRWLYHTSDIAKILGIKFKVESLDYNLNSWKSRTEYITELQNATACLNFSWKKPHFTLITFRTLDVISSGIALLQQEDPASKPLQDFFIPYKHYLPFTNLNDLSAILHVMKERPEIIHRIAQAGAEFYKARYSRDFLWSILEERFRLEAPAE
jgi:hypothetical protein